MSKNNRTIEQQIVEQTGLTTIPGLPTPTTSATEQQIAEQTGLTVIPGLETPGKPISPAQATEQQIAEYTGLTVIPGLPTPGSVSIPNINPGSTGTGTGSTGTGTGSTGTGTGSIGTGTGSIGTGTGSTNVSKDIINSMGTKPEYIKSEDTSSGASAAKNTMYSWDKQGADKAQNQYQQDVLKAKQDALANRQTIEQNALQYQQQSDMMKYANNQNAEKVGWTGGYVLDQNRQMEYLKSSIQAQMYGAMELQKYGYDSALAAARLSYDMNQKEFAHKYYQDAVNVAVTEAQLTGTYFSAETRDMMSQYAAADQELGNLKDKTIEEIEEGITNGTISLSTEQERAFEIKKNINAWYNANDVDTTGVKTLAAWQAEQAMAQEWANTQWEMYQAALASAENKDAESSTVFIAYDEEGNPIYNGASVKTLDFKTMTPEQIKEYVDSTNQIGKEQVYGYIDGTFEDTIRTYITGTKEYVDENGNKTKVINAEELEKEIKNNIKAIELGSLIGGYEYTTGDEDGNNFKIQVDKEGNVTVTTTLSDKTIKATTNYDKSTKPEQQVIDDIYSTMLEVTEYDNESTKSLDIYTIFKTNVDFNNISWRVDNIDAIKGRSADDDIDINFYYKTDKGEVRQKNYDVDINWSNQGWGSTFDKDLWNNSQDYLQKTYGTSSKDNLVFHNGELWYYNASLNKWGLVQDEAGGKKLYEDMKQASNGTMPKRWHRYK